MRMRGLWWAAVVAAALSAGCQHTPTGQQQQRGEDLGARALEIDVGTFEGRQVIGGRDRPVAWAWRSVSDTKDTSELWAILKDAARCEFDYTAPSAPKSESTPWMTMEKVHEFKYKGLDVPTDPESAKAFVAFVRKRLRDSCPQSDAAVLEVFVLAPAKPNVAHQQVTGPTTAGWFEITDLNRTGATNPVAYVWRVAVITGQQPFAIWYLRKNQDVPPVIGFKRPGDPRGEAGHVGSFTYVSTHVDAANDTLAAFHDWLTKTKKETLTNFERLDHYIQCIDPATGATCQ